MSLIKIIIPAHQKMENWGFCRCLPQYEKLVQPDFSLCVKVLLSYPFMTINIRFLYPKFLKHKSWDHGVSSDETFEQTSQNGEFLDKTTQL